MLCSLKIMNHSFQYATPHLWNKLPHILHVPYQFDPSSSPSSSPSSHSDPGPLVDLSRGIFHFHLKTFLFSKSFPPQPSIHPSRLIWNYDHSLFGSDYSSGSIGKCGRLSWLLVRTIYLLAYL